jgi:cellulose synthase/poly-beta-1,6-N-acetylglucosamine synthase-like glycosyltransferase
VARGDIVVFSDANIHYQKDALRCLVRNFADLAVGCVTGDSRYLDAHPSASHVQENTYWGYERLIRTLESQIGSTVGGDGAIFAIRRELYTPLAPEAINDLVTPLQIVARGYRAVFVNRSWRGIMSMSEILNPGRLGLFAWQVWSHKVLRWLVLPLVVVAAVGCFIASPLGMVYQLGAWAIAGSLLVASIGALISDRLGPLARLAHGVFYFYLVNLAALLGIVRALAGQVEVLWTPERN